MTTREKSSITASSSPVGQYKATGEHYLDNAIELIGKKELRKASEMLWGAVAQYVKALAASRGINIIGLSGLYEFVRELAKERDDEAISKDFNELHILHTNFYDENVPDDDFPIYYAKAIEYIGKIDNLLKIATV